jgi:predicted nucleic acid-binding protein
MARTGRFLLDTNIVIALFAREAAVQQRLAETSEVFVPSIVLGELYWLFRSMHSAWIHAVFSFTPCESALSSRASESTKRQ